MDRFMLLAANNQDETIEVVGTYPDRETACKDMEHIIRDMVEPYGYSIDNIEYFKRPNIVEINTSEYGGGVFWNHDNSYFYWQIVPIPGTEDKKEEPDAEDEDEEENIILHRVEVTIEQAFRKCFNLELDDEEYGMLINGDSAPLTSRGLYEDLLDGESETDYAVYDHDLDRTVIDWY